MPRCTAVPQSYHLGGMGCGTGVVAINLCKDLLAVRGGWVVPVGWIGWFVVSVNLLSCCCVGLALRVCTCSFAFLHAKGERRSCMLE